MSLLWWRIFYENQAIGRRRELMAIINHTIQITNQLQFTNQSNIQLVGDFELFYSTSIYLATSTFS